MFQIVYIKTLQSEHKKELQEYIEKKIINS